MKTTEHTVTKYIFQSEVLPDMQTQDPSLARVIAWADERPVVWKIVTGKRSKAFGVGSCEYIGWAQRRMAPEAVLERARHFVELIERPGCWSNANSIFAWRAQFTFHHYSDKGFTGGLFQQQDAKYARSCLWLDYTPETLEDVADKFCQWMDRYYETARVTVNGRTIREFGPTRICGRLNRL